MTNKPLLVEIRLLVVALCLVLRRTIFDLPVGSYYSRISVVSYVNLCTYISLQIIFQVSYTFYMKTFCLDIGAMVVALFHFLLSSVVFSVEFYYGRILVLSYRELCQYPWMDYFIINYVSVVIYFYVKTFFLEIRAMVVALLLFQLPAVVSQVGLYHSRILVVIYRNSCIYTCMYYFSTNHISVGVQLTITFFFFGIGNLVAALF